MNLKNATQSPLASQLLIIAALLTFVSGCSSPKPRFAEYPPSTKVSPTGMVTLTNRLDSAWLRPPTDLFTLGPGDRIEIELIGEPTSRTITVVGPDGKLYFNLLPGIDVWGLTLSQATALMETNFSQYVRGTPTVNLTLRGVESQRVWLLGRFQAPGVYAMTNGPMTVLEAIAMAGGPLSFVGTKDISSGGPLGEDLADLKRSFLVRNGQMLPIDFDRLLNKGDLTQNVYLRTDDFIYFAPAYTREVYVLGAVTQPKAVPYAEGVTVAAAIAGAFGTVRDAYLRHVTVVRGSLSQPQATTVDYKAIVAGQLPDMPLEPNDIVYVPFSPYRYLRKYAEIALNTFVSSVAINAGARLFPQDGGGGTGIFIPVGSGVQVIPPATPPIGR